MVHEVAGVGGRETIVGGAGYREEASGDEGHERQQEREQHTLTHTNTHSLSLSLSLPRSFSLSHTYSLSKYPNKQLFCSVDLCTSWYIPL